MGLFNRNKGDAPAPASTEAGTPPADNSTFDFDAISRDLDAQNGASSFDSLLAAPVTNAAQTSTDNSAFDFPEDPLGLSAPLPNAAPVAETVPIAASPESVLNAPMSPAMPTTGVAPPEPISTAPAFTRVETSKAKKSLPLVPLLGALGLLAVAGGGAMFLLNSNQNTETDSVPTVPSPGPRRPAPGVAGLPGAPLAPGAAMSPPTPDSPGAASAPAPPPGAPTAGLRSASPGIAPPPAPKQPIPAPPKGATSMAINTGQRPPAGRAPSATAGLDPTTALKLKQLWKTGAEAKHKGDFKTARAAWTEALKVKPNHPGFQDSINKLPN